MAISFLILSFVTVGVVAALAFIQARTELQQLVYRQLQVVSSVKEDELQRWIERQHDFMSFLAKAPELRSRIRPLMTAPSTADRNTLYAETSAYLTNVTINQRDTREIMLLDAANGKVMIATNTEHEGLNEADQPYFTQGRLGTYVQNAYLSPITEQPSMVVAAPLTDDNGRLRAVIAVQLDLERLDTFIQNRTGLGETGETSLIGPFNMFVSSAHFGRQPLPPGAQTDGIHAALAGTNGTGLYTNYDGVPVIGVYRWLEHEHLALLVEMQQEEAFAPARQLAATIVLVGVGCSLLLAVSVLLLARKITRPVVELTRTASQVAAGDLTQQVPIVTNDEIGTLAQAFNQMTDQLRVAYSNLQEREEHFRSLIEHASAVVLIVKRDGTISYDGPSIREILGHAHHALLGANVAALVHPDDCAALMEAIVACFTHVEHALLVEFRARRADGGWALLEGRGQFMRTERSATSVIINARDITERKRAEEERAQLQEENLRVRSEFISTVSHELRTPLTPIRGFADLLLTELSGPLNEDQRAYLSTIRANTVRMTALVDDLLDLGKLQAGKIVLQYDWVKLDLLLQRALLLFETEIQRKRLQVHFHIDPLVPSIYADARRVDQVLINLLSNAIKYTRDGGEIWLRAYTRPHRFVEVHVQDTGVGLTLEQQKKLFTPFYRADNALKHEAGGTGLGLTIVKSFVELHGGTISVQSVPEQGSTFIIALPIQGNFVVEPSDVDTATNNVTTIDYV